MKLKKIHFAGFKSFVDTTDLKLPANIIGVVGPNGCGKSNVIDAIRWVMGESSAKTLRGDNMADVIFNGSSARKPVGRASVELLFDNTDGTAPGAYAQYAEISVKRTLTRDGQSDYFLNNVKCRRKDITDLFLGTGLGPRSYSIIEQGMVSKIVEAKPEELRTFIEEAAGISKYKERRRETENRIRHTRENLERVNDIRRELDAQLSRLERQAEKAKKYQSLSKEQQQVQLETWVLQWHKVSDDLAKFDLKLAGLETKLEGFVAEQRHKETKIEQIRQEQQEAQDNLNEVQANFYRLSADITTLEQSLQHARESKLKLDQQFQRHEQDLQRLNEQLEHDRIMLEDSKLEFETQAPLLEEKEALVVSSRDALQKQEVAMQSWQEKWDLFQDQSKHPETEKNVQQARIQQLEARIENTKEQLQRNESEVENVSRQMADIDVETLKLSLSEQETIAASLKDELAETGEKIRDAKLDQVQIDENLSSKRHQLHELSGKLSSLNELQKAAMGGDDDKLVSWLEQHKLTNSPRIASMIKVDSKWEKAVDTVMQNKLTAICLPQIQDKLAGDILNLSKSEDLLSSELTVFESQLNVNGKTTSENRIGCRRLLQEIESDVDLSPWLHGVYIVETYAEATSYRHQLEGNELLVMPNGVMMGANWMSLPARSNAKGGLVSREKAIKSLTRQIETLEKSIGSLETDLTEVRRHTEQLELQRTDLQNKYNEALSESTNQQARLKNEEQRLSDLTARKQEMMLSLQDARQQLVHLETELEVAREKIENALKQSDDLNVVRADLINEKDEIQDLLQRAREDNEANQQSRYELKLSVQNLESKITAIENNIQRNENQLQNLSEHKEQLLLELEDAAMPDNDKQNELTALYAQKEKAALELKEAKDALSGFENELILNSQQRQKAENEAQITRDILEKERLSRQEWVIEKRNLQLQIEQSGNDADEILKSLDESAELRDWKEKLSELNRKIGQLGAVNLLAIEEYEEQSERKQYLDQQHDDLVEAMETLEKAINKIDKETKERFKITYTMLNDSFQKIFPQLFGGGSASLQLTDNDFLYAGVSVVARPPGKRNSTIHLLSGGEKALTAVSLLFALFQLSPAPFCILDEVDAPLDDANVERYCRILKQMSVKTQLLFITHNKITMEIADILVGVTMQEPGVSKIVAVDVEEAVELAS